MATPSSSPRPRGLWMRRMRHDHRLLGLFFAPAILFFAITGAMQALGLHEAKGGAASRLLAEAASLHKHQRLWKPKPAAAAGPAAPADPAAPAPREHPALRLFVVLMAAALAASALSGCVIAVHLRTTRRQALIALAAGILVPLLLYAL